MEQNSKRYHYFYKITNNLNGNYYYGIHSTDNLEDGYMGSGIKIRKSIANRGVENFTKEILKYFNTREEASLYESKAVNVEILKDPKCYNLRTGGDVVRLPGGRIAEESVQKASQTRRERMADPAYRQALHDKRSKAAKGKPKPTGFGEKLSKVKKGVPGLKIRGVPKSEEHRRKISESLTGRYLSEEHKEHLRHPKYNSTYVKSEEHRKHLSEAGKRRVQTQATKDAISKARKGKIWVISLETQRKKLIWPEQLDEFLVQGFEKYHSNGRRNKHASPKRSFREYLR